MRLLLIEDDAMIGDSLKKALTSYVVDWARDADTATAALRTAQYDLVLLDLGLPGRSGIEFLQQLRRSDSALPVLIITARDTVQDRILGLDQGADDYLVKPFDLNELEARIRALLRRHSDSRDPLVQCGEAVLDPATRQLTYQGTVAILSARTYALMEVLMRRPGSILSRAQLESQIYGWDEEVESNAIEVHIHALRKQFGAGLIRNIRGVGYTVPSTTASA